MYWHCSCDRFVCLLQDTWSCSINLRKHITVFMKQNSYEGCEFNRSEVLNLLEISVFVSVRRNSGLSGATLFCLKFAFILSMYMSCNIFLGRCFICEIFVGKSHSFCQSLSWALWYSTLSHTHFFLLNLWLQMPIPPWKKR